MNIANQPINPDDMEWEELFDYLVENHPLVWEVIRYCQMDTICETARKIIKDKQNEH